MSLNNELLTRTSKDMISVESSYSIRQRQVLSVGARQENLSQFTQDGAAVRLFNFQKIRKYLGLYFNMLIT